MMKIIKKKDTNLKARTNLVGLPLLLISYIFNFGF